MKNYTNRSIKQKTIIVILTVFMLTFAIPKPVEAATNIILSPILSLGGTILDAIQHTIESAMLGESNFYMKDIDRPDTYAPATDSRVVIEVDPNDIAGSLFGWDKVNVPVINYTPEEIFSNKVPMLDVNFIKPSVKTNGQIDLEENIASQLQPTIASWYIAIRTMAVVGLLSVLVYLGIRMLLTSVAADRAKYKKMIMDWLVAMCLVFMLHYIMSFVLTMSEVVISMIANPEAGSVSVHMGEYNFDTNLMGYVRFMIQSKDSSTSIGFFFLYLMLVIYTVRFTWTYLKRVANMAFLTLIAPAVALTYPIDKVSDGKAQAFNIWLKEFIFNGLLQPLHLFLYMVLLGSATELAVRNPLYAIVCLGFILAAEKLLKQMFGFNKAGAGTVGSLAGAAGVSALAHKAVMSLGKGPHGGPPGKVRTNDSYQRDGRNSRIQKEYDSFNTDKPIGIPEVPTSDNESGEESEGIRTPGKQNNDVLRASDNLPSPESDNSSRMAQDNGEVEGNEQRDTLDDLEQQRAELYNQGYTDNSQEIQDINQKIQNGDFAQLEQEQEQPDTTGSPDPEMTAGMLGNLGQYDSDAPETWKDMFRQDRQRVKDAKLAKKDRKEQDKIQKAIDKKSGALKERRKEQRRMRGIAAYKTIKGVAKATPTVAYSATRGTLKTATRLALGGALAATAGVIGATTGDGEKALSMAGAAFAVGAGTGGKLFESTVGKGIQQKKIRDSYGAGKYGSAIDARNARADKEFLKSQEFNEYYEKYFQGKKSKKEVQSAFKSYRESGITDKSTIRKAMALEDKYLKNGGDQEAVRQNVQGIIQTRGLVDSKAYSGDAKAIKASKERIERQLTNIKDEKIRKQRAEQLFQGYQDFYDLG